MSATKIPVKNIYYMLCYAWNLLGQSENILVGSEEFDNIYNLFARVYINGVNGLIKKGLNRYYLSEKEALSSLRGKIKIADSIREQTLFSGKIVCQFDDFSENIKLNQIVKSTIDILIKVPSLDFRLREKLLILRRQFYNINGIPFTKYLFSSLRYNRNNSHYRMLINVSQLIYEGLIVSEIGSEILFADFVRDAQMAKLYEKFVLNFYKTHLDGSVFNIHSPKLKWDLDEELSKEDLLLLPEMRTDIVVENKVKNEQMIIDTKYYEETLVTSNWTEIEKVRAGHLYQIYAYVNNSDYRGNVMGTLLYPTIQKETNRKFPIRGKNILIRTLNLNTEWQNIHDTLVSLVI